ncbi:MAG: UDP-N-acetylmuramate--L-alanine ligase [Oscillospiraceae bacterium]|jgi:UDP-N-acetylmuramate--alanine ligase|nr:UDP-N-acetylmuramate--L-alanine ligase [Oscillospiraceae bacterium]
MDSNAFKKFILSGKKCHLVGIGGVSMSPLAEILHGIGIEVSGSDVAENAAINKLRLLGINVIIGHYAENLSGVGYIIRTAAAREDNVEIMTARNLNIPVFERAQAWGHIMREYKNAVCISGTHGKTTTTSMVSHILLAADTDPTIMIGGTLPVLESGCRVGKGDVIVLESCEYYNSFHNFHPTVAVILNIDTDHLDFFKDLDELKESFCTFASLAPDDGHIVCNGDDINTMEAIAPLDRKLFTFGFNEYVYGGNTPMCVRGVNVSVSGRMPSMDVLYDGKIICKITLRMPGMHNLENALAAAAACLAIGIPPKAIEDGLYNYTGVGRRFEFKGTFNGADVYDDYAHHPRELHALLNAVDSLDCYKRVILAFQPHTFSRTKALFSDFVTQLRRPDIVLLTEIYAARETNDVGITSSVLADAVPGARCISEFSKLTDTVRSIAREGDIILTVGAGDIFKIGEALV